MEMNVRFEVQRALAEVILSHYDKWRQRCHVEPSPRLSVYLPELPDTAPVSVFPRQVKLAIMTCIVGSDFQALSFVNRPVS
ncbi:hypothetical protein F7725_001027 [Dissostichus mawsoni]|uniref:Uncharacterized protein n=1 Tax=Dissostichus mawsoni TaxID=36200 RepID=A0A7J5ZG25_DISMA|nr:hypothetical protein F7725_001027 [Dissostichus mawsoni]